MLSRSDLEEIKIGRINKEICICGEPLLLIGGRIIIVVDPLHSYKHTQEHRVAVNQEVVVSRLSYREDSP